MQKAFLTSSVLRAESDVSFRLSSFPRRILVPWRRLPVWRDIISRRRVLATHLLVLLMGCDQCPGAGLLIHRLIRGRIGSGPKGYEGYDGCR